MRRMSSSVAMSPAMTAAGSPGVRYRSENTTNATTAITTTVEKRRRTMYAIIRVGPDSSGPVAQALRRVRMNSHPRKAPGPWQMLVFVGPDSSGRANEFAPTDGTQEDRYFFSTFHMRLIGATITPERFVR